VGRGQMWKLVCVFHRVGEAPERFAKGREVVTEEFNLGTTLDSTIQFRSAHGQLIQQPQ